VALGKLRVRRDEKREMSRDLRAGGMGKTAPALRRGQGGRVDCLSK